MTKCVLTASAPSNSENQRQPIDVSQTKGAGTAASNVQWNVSFLWFPLTTCVSSHVAEKRVVPSKKLDGSVARVTVAPSAAWTPGADTNASVITAARKSRISSPPSTPFEFVPGQRSTRVGAVAFAIAPRTSAAGSPPPLWHRDESDPSHVAVALNRLHSPSPRFRRLPVPRGRSSSRPTPAAPRASGRRRSRTTSTGLRSCAHGGYCVACVPVHPSVPADSANEVPPPARPRTTYASRGGKDNAARMRIDFGTSRRQWTRVAAVKRGSSNRSPDPDGASATRDTLGARFNEPPWASAVSLATEGLCDARRRRGLTCPRKNMATLRMVHRCGA
jgi:hypothetical protein